VQRTWRGSLYFWWIWASQVGEIEFQFLFTALVIVKTLELRCSIAVNNYGIWKTIWSIWGIKRWATRTGEVPDVEGRVDKGSADGDGGVRNQIDCCKSMPWSTNMNWGIPIQQSSPSMRSSTEWGGGYGALKEIFKHQSRLWSADRDWGASIHQNHPSM